MREGTHLNLSVHSDVTFFVRNEQRAEDSLHLKATLERLSDDAHRRRVHHHLALLPLHVTLPKSQRLKVNFASRGIEVA